jgi:MFS family permease
MFISAVDSTIVNVGLPEISRDLNARLGGLQWVIDGFLVCLGGMLLVGSGLADRFGRRRVFLCGVAGFGATSVLAALSQTTGELIAARVRGSMRYRSPGDLAPRRLTCLASGCRSSRSRRSCSR